MLGTERFDATRRVALALIVVACTMRFVGLETSPLMTAAGAIMGFRAAASMLGHDRPAFSPIRSMALRGAPPSSRVIDRTLERARRASRPAVAREREPEPPIHEIMVLGNEQAEWNRRTRDLIANARPTPVMVNDTHSR